MAARRTPGVTVRVNEDGTSSYRIRWRQGGGRGPQLSHTFSRLGEAADMLARIKANGKVCVCPEHAPASSRATLPNLHDQPEHAGLPTFGTYADAHVEALTGVGPGYRSRFHRELARHFAPFLNEPLSGITTLDVRMWIRGMEEGTHPWTIRRVPGTGEWAPYPMSPTTIRRLLVQAGSVMAEAQKEGLIRGNPFRGHRVGRHEQQDRSEVMRMVSPREWRLLWRELPEGLGRDLCSFLLTTGLRFGEATALRVSDVDVARGQVFVRRAWVSDGRAGRVVGVPKSARSNRVVSVGPTALEAVAAHLVGKGPGELVFTAPAGGPVLPSNFFHRVWKPAVDRAVAHGLARRPRVHDLRHSFASWALAEGVPLLNVSRALGHSSPQITGVIYAQVHPEAADRAATAVERALGR